MLSLECQSLFLSPSKATVIRRVYKVRLFCFCWVSLGNNGQSLAISFSAFSWRISNSHSHHSPRLLVFITSFVCIVLHVLFYDFLLFFLLSFVLLPLPFDYGQLRWCSLEKRRCSLFGSLYIIWSWRCSECHLQVSIRVLLYTVHFTIFTCIFKWLHFAWAI